MEFDSQEEAIAFTVKNGESPPVSAYDKESDLPEQFKLYWTLSLYLVM